MKKDATILVLGSTGLVGSAVVRLLKRKGYTKVLTPDHNELELMKKDEIGLYFCANIPEYVFLCAAKAGGIIANSKYPADYIYENIQIQTNVIKVAHDYGVKKLLFLGSSCIYPKHATQPMTEEMLMTGDLEYTNEAYAVAKIAGIMMCKKFKEQYKDNFVSVMPCNLYGEEDNFDLETSHVIPALINKFIYAKNNKLSEVTIWGTGKPTREFLYVDDLAEALLFVMKRYDGLDFLNIGSGEEISIANLSRLIGDMVGFKGDVIQDRSKPDGTPRKVLNVDKINKLGWHYKTDLRTGLKKTIKWYLDKYIR